MKPLETAQLYVTLHNAGVAGGDFSEMLNLFDEEGELHFDGLRLGPFIGCDAIASAFREHPPSDHLLLLTLEEHESGIHATYSWRSAPNVAAGTIEGTIRDGRIVRWVVTVIPQP